MEREICQTCWVKHGKSLWAGSCICTGHVNPVFTPPGKLDFNPKPWELPEDKPKKVETKAQKKKSFQS